MKIRREEKRYFERNITKKYKEPQIFCTYMKSKSTWNDLKKDIVKGKNINEFNIRIDNKSYRDRTLLVYSLLPLYHS